MIRKHIMRKHLLKDIAVLTLSLLLLLIAFSMRAGDNSRQSNYANEYTKKSTDKFEFSVFPNPFITATRFRIVQGNKQITELRVYDLLGKTIARKEICMGEPVISYTIDLSETEPGVYFCSVYEGNQIVSTRKLVKAKQ